MSARTRELFGLLPVSLLVAAGFAAVLATRTEDVSDATLTYGAFFLGLCVLAHLFIRARLPDADPYLFPLAAVLAAVGLVMIYRIDETKALDQATWFVVGLILSVGPLEFQPAEFAKIAIIVFLASYLNDTREVLVTGRIPRLSLKHFGPLLLVWGAAMLMLVFIRDLGSSLMFFGGFLALLYVATARLSLVAAGFGLFLAGSAFFANNISHVQERVDIWLDPFAKDVVDD